MKNSYGGKCIGLKNHMFQRKSKIKFAFNVGDRVGTTYIRRNFQREYDKSLPNGLEKFLKFQKIHTSESTYLQIS